MADGFAAVDRSLQAVVMDYALWNEMVAFVGEPGAVWSRENLSPWLALQHGIDFVAVVDREHRLVFASDPTGTWSSGDSLKGERAIVHARRHPTKPFLWRTPRADLWVAGAPIQPTLSPSFTPPGQGTFFAGFVLTPRFVERLAAVGRPGPAEEVFRLFGTTGPSPATAGASTD